MKQQTKKVSPWKLGALSVLCTVLFVALACTEEHKTDVTENDKPSKDIFVVVEQLPQAVGGMSAFYNQLAKDITYPAEALQNRIEGRVSIEFIVEKNGSLSDVKAIMGIGSGCDEEAVRAVESASAFKPASQSGKPVRVRMLLPIDFRIDKTNSGSGSVQVLEIQPVNASFKVTANYNNGEWSGVVYDEEGEGLPGVNVIVEGTTTGTVSDLDGSFKVKAVESENLHLSFVGYESVRLNNKELTR
jgi:TonB family protein